MRKRLRLFLRIMLAGSMVVSALGLVAGDGITAAEGGDSERWRRHTIDSSSRGADGTRLADANGDGLPDIVTGWEQGGVTRLYLNPGAPHVSDPWPAVTVGLAPSVEDAVMVDLDRDGAIDVVSSCEGQRQALLIHWGSGGENLLNPDAWTTQAIPASEQKCRWMFATPMDVDRDGRVDLVAGGKGAGSELGWWKVPVNARDIDRWEWHPLLPVGWLMSLETVDMNGDGQLDLLYTDRKGNASGCFWLEHPGDDSDALARAWPRHTVGVEGREAMFLRRADVDADGLEDVVIAVRPDSIVICRRLDELGDRWVEQEITLPETYGTAKAPGVADMDGDGKLEIVFSTENASNGRMGVGIWKNHGERLSGPWIVRTISGVDGVKHDLVEILDLDGDGDLDVMTCEEVTGLGVIWYENPSNAPHRG